MVERLAGEPHIRLRFFCSPHHEDSALYPVISHLERAAAFHRDDTAEQRLDKLEALLAQATNDVSAVAPLLADLLAVPTGERYPALNLTPQKRKEKTLAALTAQVEGLSAREPVLMVYEDVHWSDPTTRESLDLLVDRLPGRRILAIITFRPEFDDMPRKCPILRMSTVFRSGLRLLVLVQRRKFLPARGLRLVDAEVVQLHGRALRPRFAITAFALIAFLSGRHFDQQFASAALGAQPDLGRLGDERRVLGLSRVGLHRDRLVADAFHLINAVSPRQRAAGGVVADQGMAASGLRGRAGTPYCHGAHINPSW
jgi:hypothetical protein